MKKATHSKFLCLMLIIALNIASITYYASILSEGERTTFAAGIILGASIGLLALTAHIFFKDIFNQKNV